MNQLTIIQTLELSREALLEKKEAVFSEKSMEANKEERNVDRILECEQQYRELGNSITDLDQMLNHYRAILNRFDQMLNHHRAILNRVDYTGISFGNSDQPLTEETKKALAEMNRTAR
jgi:hypothetical protein